jgi:hypothetical protein
VDSRAGLDGFGKDTFLASVVTSRYIAYAVPAGLERNISNLER